MKSQESEFKRFNAAGGLAVCLIVVVTYIALSATTLFPGGASYAQNEGKAGGYRVVTRKDRLHCEFSQDLSLSLNYGLSGTANATGNHFDCLDARGKERSIRLTSVNPANGKVAIETKDFGTMFRGDEPGTFNKYWMTDSQIEKLKAFLGYTK